eukprot:g1767.t1
MSGYDRYITVFSPEGRLYQIEYATKAANVSNPLSGVGLRGKNCSVLVMQKVVKDKLIDPASVTNLHNLTKRVGTIASGRRPDALSVIDTARKTAYEFRYNNGYTMPCHALSQRTADLLQVDTQYARKRPLAVNLLIATVDIERGSQLFKIDPAGFCRPIFGGAVGSKRQELETQLEKTLKENERGDIDATIREAIKVMTKVHRSDFKKTELEIGYVDGPEGDFVRLTEEQIEEHLVAMHEAVA